MIRTRDFSWIAGVFVLDTSFAVRFREKIDFGRDGVFDPVSIDQVRSFAPGDYGFISDAITERESVSVYFQGDNPISNQLNLVSGVRLTDSATWMEGSQISTLGAAPIYSRFPVPV